MSAPLVSLCLTSFQYAGYVDASLLSALGQRDVELEVIVIDDASTDGSWEILQRSARDSRVRLIQHGRNQGFLTTRAEAVALARGRYIVTLDADDLIIDPSALRSQADLLDAEPTVGLVCADFDLIDHSGRRIGRRRPPLRRVTRGRDAFRTLLKGNRIMHSGTMFRRACIDQLGSYDPGFEDCADWELWLRIAAHWDVGRIARPLYAYRIHDRNMFRRGDPDERRRVVLRARTYAPNVPAVEMQRALASAHATAAAIHIAAARTAPAVRQLLVAVRTDWRALLDVILVRAVIRLVVVRTLGAAAGIAIVRFLQRSTHR